jgi:Asp-tRNA(Asn)/Glu-tRNA(Gln) amidotransferase A subunit family amidase
LPVGVQIVGPAWQDLTTIEVGKMMERLGCAYLPPPMAAGGAASL